jgi:nanoRNase/pAp phosphatase (c-di-AMP/oligoRNAs hydrolase)
MTDGRFTSPSDVGGTPSRRPVEPFPVTEQRTEWPTDQSGALVGVLERRRGQKLVLAIRGFPDPDSIACAMAMNHIASHHGVDSLILYFDEISHEENRALVKKLGVEMIRCEPKFSFEAFDGCVIMDAQVPELPVDPGKPLPLVAFIDHHKQIGSPSAEFVDIREDLGATSSILAEYLAAGAAPMRARDPEHEKLATALMHGIRSDTDDFFSAREADYRAAAYLAPLADLDLLRTISYQAISPRTMDVTQRALEKKIIRDTFLLAGVGFVREEDRDAIGQAADYLVRREGIDTVIVYGIVNDRWIDGSLRTNSAKIDPDRLLKELFGADDAGRPYGGGRAEKGGFRIPIGTFAFCTDRDLLWKISQRTIEDMVFSKLGLSREDD